jgi:signal transduction histidine kinase
MLLIDKLIKDAGDEERNRISLDVHDTTIQPYIGLTLALEGLCHEFKNNTLLTEKIDQIINMANMTIKDLRSYKDKLREKSLLRGDFLVTAINNQVERLQRFYGIKVVVNTSIDPNLSGRFAEAAFHIINEGLSNILRHTNTKNAYLSVQTTETHLLLEIGNETSNLPSVLVRNVSPYPTLFIPKSIQERSAKLNGEMIVKLDSRSYTVVSVSIPLL